MKKLILSKWFLALAGCLAFAIAPLQAANPADSLKGNLVRLEASKLNPTDAAALDGVKYYAFYYSAHWCPPCRAFTPELVDFYKRNKKKHPQFEIIFVSSDQSDADMKKYMETYHMPWLAVDFAKSKEFQQYAGPGIPCLVVVDENGTVLENSFEGDNYVGPAKVMEALGKRLRADAKTTAGSSEVKAPFKSELRR
ncbi:MAG TPA: thioredoxin-like domain-containing protein [Chthoniobacteraceae bacterium]|nr:thioredoxin-like domain-containing protein [Chthoniobacteraceae bacterium]